MVSRAAFADRVGAHLSLDRTTGKAKLDAGRQ
jgi:hypothetical protein